MRTHRLRYIGLTACTLAVAGFGSLRADDKPAADKPAAEKPAEPEGQLLFDGKTLTNWKPTDFGRVGKIEVKDGLLIINKGEPMSGVTWAGDELPRVDYELRLEAKRVAGNDFFCGLTFPVQKNCCSLILGGWGGGLTGISSINYSDASENETTNFYDFTLDKWYKVRVKVTQSKIECTLDGDVVLADVEYKDKKIDVRFEMESCKPLGIATYNTTGAVRNFRLIKLNAEGEPVKEASSEK
jgi:hypothetical protein